ncbi:DnaT-like ssDNA-binding protein [Janthinobacterium sp. UMAB-56]|uniref:DnaT-like ssDNA-binding protein n=1 Tax=Janthinobacterium sp. UMAB-56 TaxID=1365361 RepID=UPI001C55E228|nr:DnaT-like ssDNA-binding protein [Janthinobacterium sp. UMAB-56]
MPIVIETGAGLADAESYASIAAADARCASLGLTSWAALAEAESYATHSGVV